MINRCSFCQLFMLIMSTFLGFYPIILLQAQSSPMRMAYGRVVIPENGYFDEQVINDITAYTTQLFPFPPFREYHLDSFASQWQFNKVWKFLSNSKK